MRDLPEHMLAAPIESTGVVPPTSPAATES
jgi:hypothetical protein